MRQSQIKGTNIGSGSAGSDLVQFQPAFAQTTGNTEARDIRVFDNAIRGANHAVVCTVCGDALVAHNLICDARLSVFRLVLAHGPLGRSRSRPPGAQLGGFGN